MDVGPVALAVTVRRGRKCFVDGRKDVLLAQSVEQTAPDTPGTLPKVEPAGRLERKITRMSEATIAISRPWREARGQRADDAHAVFRREGEHGAAP